MSDPSVQIEHAGKVGWLWLNRPATHNAFDEVLIEALIAGVQQLQGDASVRVIVLGGRGKSFSAGADLSYMRRQGEASAEANEAAARRMADVFRVLADSRKPTLARVQGAAMGGGMGLAAACHICVASEQAVFATSEARFGLIPGVISPYVIRAIGERQAYRYFQSAERIHAQRAFELGLAHEVVPAAELDAAVQAIVAPLLIAGPAAQAAATNLIRAVAGRPVDDALVADTARRIARLRATPEAQEGLAAFIEKRPASWTQ